MKIFIETTQGQAQKLEPQKRPLKAKTPETYLGQPHFDYYHFCQQCENYFETSDAKEINCIFFATSYLRGTICLKWA